jgi:hypothetical protein
MAGVRGTEASSSSSSSSAAAAASARPALELEPVPAEDEAPCAALGEGLDASTVLIIASRNPARPALTTLLLLGCPPTPMAMPGDGSTLRTRCCWSTGCLPCCQTQIQVLHGGHSMPLQIWGSCHAQLAGRRVRRAGAGVGRSSIHPRSKPSSYRAATICKSCRAFAHSMEVWAAMELSNFSGQWVAARSALYLYFLPPGLPRPRRLTRSTLPSNSLQLQTFKEH